MEKSEIKKEIGIVLTSVLKHNDFELKDELTATDVDGWDSLTHINIISEIEGRFNIKFKLKELNKLKNLGSLADIVELKLQQ